MSVAAHRFDNDRRYRDGDHPSQTWFTPDVRFVGGATG